MVAVQPVGDPLVGTLSSLGQLSATDLMSAFANAPIGMAVLTPEGVVSAANRGIGSLLGLDPAELVGTTFFDVCHPDDLAVARHNCALMAEGLESIVRHECRFVGVDGQVTWVLVSTSRVAETASRRAHLIMHIEDITARKYLESQLVHQALHDPLTGIGNRAMLEQSLTAPGRPGQQDSLLLLDLNGFKNLNDTHGHLVGDRLLQAFAARLEASLGDGDVAIRLGGDEFAVLCPDTSEPRAGELCGRLRAVLEEQFVVDGHEISVRAAVGSATLPRTGEDPAVRMAALLLHADRAMYADKSRPGRQRDRRASPRR